MSLTRPTQPLRIGEFVFDPGLNELHRAGATQRLPAKLADLLLRLAAEPGRMLSRDTLIDEVWERRQVNDEVLSRAIAELRQALGDDARAPRYVETLPKLGYRLIAPVAPAADQIAAASAPEPDSDLESQTGRMPPGRSAAASRSPVPAYLVLALALAAGALYYLGRDATTAPDTDEASGAAIDSAQPTASANTATRAAAVLSPANLLRARPFTTEPGRELFPRFTPDARWVIYTRAGGEGEAAQLRLRAVDGTEDRALVADANDNYCGSVSPDGATLAWLRARPGVCELVHRALLGGPARVIAGCAANSLANCPDWSPDGHSLLLSGNASERGLIRIGYPDGGVQVLSHPPEGSYDLMPRHREDGGEITFWRGDSWGRALLALDPASGAERALRPRMQLAFGHAYLGNEALLLADDSHGQRALLRFDPVTGGDALLGALDARFPDVARNGALVYEVARYDANLWRIDLKADPSAAAQRLTTSARYDSQPAYSPDGAWLAFGSNRDGREGIYLIRPDGTEERKLPLDPALRWTAPVWTPDGHALLVLRYDEHGSQFCLHPIATTQTRCLPELGRDRNVAFFFDATSLGFVDAEAAHPRLWRADLASGEVRDAGLGTVDRCAVSARWQVCHRPGQPGLQVQERQGGPARELLPEMSQARGAWALSGDALYFVLRAAADAAHEPGIYRLDLNSGAQRRVGMHLPSAIGTSIAVAPDESALVIARTDGLETDLMYVPPP